MKNLFLIQTSVWFKKIKKNPAKVMDAGHVSVDFNPCAGSRWKWGHLDPAQGFMSNLQTYLLDVEQEQRGGQIHPSDLLLVLMLRFQAAGLGGSRTLPTKKNCGGGKDKPAGGGEASEQGDDMEAHFPLRFQAD